MSEVTVKFKEMYWIETPKTLVIGDPLYFEELESPNIEEKYKENMRNLIFAKNNIPKTHKAKLIFSELDCDGYTVHEAKVVVTNAKYLEVYSNDQYYPDAVLEDEDLGCDTAQYTIYVGDDRYYNVHTGADGYI